MTPDRSDKSYDKTGDPLPNNDQKQRAPNNHPKDLSNPKGTRPNTPYHPREGEGPQEGRKDFQGSQGHRSDNDVVSEGGWDGGRLGLRPTQTGETLQRRPTPDPKGTEKGRYLNPFATNSSHTNLEHLSFIFYPKYINLKDPQQVDR